MLPVPMAMVPVIWKVIVFPRGANRGGPGSRTTRWI
jgi:hypothetical protein